MRQPVGKTLLQQFDFGNNLKSRIIDGILPAVILILTWLLVVLTIHPIQQALGQPGLMIYTLGLLAIAMFALQHAVLEKHSHILRAWYGIASGFLGWAVTEVSISLNAPIFAAPGGVILIIMVALVFYILWKNGLPVGARFFVTVFLMNWFVHLFVDLQEFFSSESALFTLTYRATGYFSILGMVAILVYILFHSRRRIERICASVGVWFLFSLAVYVFWGKLY